MTDIATEPVLLRTDDEGIVTLTINRPRKGNALSVDVIDALDDAVTSLREDTAAHAVIITGAGPKVFSAGADINNLLGLSRDQARDQMLYGQRVFSALEDLPQPIIAAINGIAFGGGLELAMACDMRIAKPSAILGQPEITLANLPGWAGTQRLPRLVGEGRALEIILTGDSIDANRAHDIGLVNAVSADPLAAAHELARRIIRHAPGAVDAAKRAVYAGLRSDIAAGSALEAELVGDRCVTAEQRLAVETFLNRKNTPAKDHA